jgi:predicted nucleotidyltransferase
MAARQRIREHRDEILRVAPLHGAGNVLLFGSVVRGKDTPESDVDLLSALEEIWLAS